MPLYTAVKITIDKTPYEGMDIINSNLDAIEEVLNSLDTSIDEGSTALSDLAGIVSGIQGDLSGVITRLDEVESELEVVTPKVNEHEIALDGLEDIPGRVETLETALGELQGEVDNIGSEPPGLFDYTTGTLVVAEGSHVIENIDIPFDRLYGVFVEVVGLTEGQEVQVEFLGGTPGGVNEDVQYEAEFTSDLSADTSQAWRYRDNLSSKTLHARITNTAGGTANITLNVIAEPF